MRGDDVRWRGPVAVGGVMAILAAWSAPLAWPERVPEGPNWTVAYDQVVAGDVAVVGNTVTRCPYRPGIDPCRAAENGVVAAGNPASLNNGNRMVWADTDANPDTFTSSSARLAIPGGARVAHATLTWGGDLRAGSTGRCARGGVVWPPGSPEAQPVVLSAGSAPAATIRPDRFVVDPVRPGQDRWYTASADVSDHLAGIAGSATVTVGNIWTGQGLDCFGGWSLMVVWATEPSGTGAPAVPRHRVVLYLGHHRIGGPAQHTELRAPGLHAPGGTTRLGVVAYEGDRGLDGDSLSVNGQVRPEPAILGGARNFFVSNAAGALAPAHVNNMSVDAKTIDLGSDVVRPGDTALDVEFGRVGSDEYLVQGLMLSVPLPGIDVRTTVDHPVAHAGDRLAQQAVVTNTGGVPLAGIDVAFDLDPRCLRRIERLAPGSSTSLTCSGTAGDADRPLTASARGTAPSGATVAARSTTRLRVIHPDLLVRGGVRPKTVLVGEPVEYELVAVNTGDSPLTSVALRAVGVVGCDQVVATVLAPGTVASGRCTVPAGARNVSTRIEVSARDELASVIADSMPVGYAVVRASMAMEITGPRRAVTSGDDATVIVRLRNTSSTPLTDVVITGEPTGCRRDVGRLEPMAGLVYACRVTVDQPTVVSLAASGVPEVNGRVVDRAFAVRQAGQLELVPVPPGQPRPTLQPAPPPLPTPPPESRVQAATGPLESPMVAPIIGAMAVLVMTVSMGSLSAATRPRK